jgi:hypothetical protein
VARPRRAHIWVLAGLAAALALAGCGGSGGSSTTATAGGTDQAQVSDAIRTSVTSSDPADCTRLETQRFIEQIHFTKGQEALRACERDAPDTSDDPDSVDVTDVQVNGSSATANAAFHGGGFDGSTLSLALVKDGEQWKLDQITAVPTFDLQAFSKAFTQRLGSNQNVPAAATACITKALDSAGPDSVKGALISGESSQLLSLIAPCLSASTGA